MRAALVSVVLVASCASGLTAAPVAPGVVAPSPEGEDADAAADGGAPDVSAPSPEGEAEGEAEGEDESEDATGAPEAAALMEERMAEVNRTYDRGDIAGARAMALKVLADAPDNVRMLRVLVSTSCILGDADQAKAYWLRLTTARDREQMAQRCDRFGVDVRAE